MNHDELTKRAAAWLRRTCAVVITEISGGSERPDAIGFMSDGSTILIECKTSRADFLSDRKKFFRRLERYGMGTRRYYMVPTDLILADETSGGWGLLEVRKSRVYKTMESAIFTEVDALAEKQVLISLIRRIGQRPVDGVSVKFYTYQTGNTATCGALNPGNGK